MIRTRLLLLGLALFSLSASAQPPSVNASNLRFTNVYCNQLRVSWTNGNGDSRVVLVQEGGTSLQTNPVDFQSYNANTEFGKGTKLNDSTYSVFSGTGSSVDITGLKKNTRYVIAVYEFNTNSGNYEYLTGTGIAESSVTTESITANFTIDDRYQCLDGNNFTFTNTSSNTIGGGMTYVWDLGDGSTKPTTTNVTHSYTVGGIFKVKLTATTTGCVTDTVIRDTVVVPYQVNFFVDTLISFDTVQCYGNNEFSLKNWSRVPNPPIYGAWDRSRSNWTTTQGHAGAGFDFQFQTKIPGKITVKLVMGRQVQPGAEFCLDSFERVVEVRPPPLDTTDILISDSVLCLATNEFTFSHAAPDIVQTTWSFGDGNSSNMNPVTYSYSTEGRFEVLLEVEDINGCTGEYADSVEIVATPNNFFTGLGSTYCLGDPMVDLNPNLPGGVFEGSTSIDPINQTFDPSTLGIHTISYIYTIGNCKDTFTATTEVLPKPVFGIGPDTVICINTDITLTADDPTLTYVWDDQTPGVSRTVTGPGTFWAEGDDGQCSARDSVEIRRVTLPTLDLGNDTSICGGEALSYDISTDAGSIVWSDGSPDGFTRSITESGFYKATITHPCGVVSDSILVEILPSACDIFIPNAFSPNDDRLNEVFYPKGLFRFTSLMIFNEYGMQLFESFEEGVGWDGKVNGVVSPPGTYYYVIRYQLPEEGTYVKKVASGPIYLLW